ncbi:MAG: [FeFe] hydrogenase, group A [Agathobaculum sp.]|jgi:NADP-reducing hydrogenase subunit HndD|uniref:[FeFe] hydrogenase, group A n=1 Tax=Agathobaculum sp. TaxID=2048138 RepID=UPI003D921040
MVNLTINDIPVSAAEGTTILEAAASVNIEIPKLCYLKDINEISACRVCCVEVEGEGKLVPSCNNVVREGMVIHTNSPRVREARRTNVELILSQHDSQCATCTRSGTCQLQKVATDLGILTNPYPADLLRGKKAEWTTTFPLFRDPNKCIKCMRCVQVCDKIQALSVWNVSGSGSRTTIDVSENRFIKEADCSLCGQCITHCPTGALRERDDTAKAFAALADPDKITIVQIAPAVRTAWGEAFGMESGEATVGQIVSALRKMGANYVFDTTFSADLTIMEEGTELLARLKAGDLAAQPMFTSCCPGWVRFLKSQFPEMTGCLSTSKSPQQMFGAVIKTWLAYRLGVDPAKIYSISIMPCVAKKAECELPDMQSAGYGQDVDLVLTTRELARMVRAEHLEVPLLEESPFDSPLGDGSGAGVIFGATGGVMEAALRSAYFLVNGQNPPADAFRDVRARTSGEGSWREATFDLGGTAVRCAVTSGLGNARLLLNAINRGEVQYEFVEIMACPGGCAGGGGQPVDGSDREKAAPRGSVLYELDEQAQIRFSHENPAVQALYQEYLDAPCSEKAEHLLHCNHFAWEMPQNKKLR